MFLHLLLFPSNPYPYRLRTVHFCLLHVYYNCQFRAVLILGRPFGPLTMCVEGTDNGYRILASSVGNKA